jgi:hypothetical protein
MEYLLGESVIVMRLRISFLLLSVDLKLNYLTPWLWVAEIKYPFAWKTGIRWSFFAGI